MIPLAKEGDDQKANFNAKDASLQMQMKGTTMKNMKKYLPESAFNKTVKSSTTKSLLKFRQRQEKQDLKKVQQYKSYQRVMKREGYCQTNDDKNNRKRHRYDTNSNDHNDNKEKYKASLDHESLATESDNKHGVNMSELETIQESTNIVLQESKQNAHVHLKNKPENINLIADGSKRASMNCGDDANGTRMQTEKSNKKWRQLDEEKRRNDEYKQRQIQIEREKKEKFRQRQQRHRLLSARTSRGQPIMKNIALDILNKLQREQQQQQQQTSTQRHH